MTKIDNSKEAVMKMRLDTMKKYQEFEEHLIEQLKDPKEALAFIDAIMEDYHVTKNRKTLQAGEVYLNVAGHNEDSGYIRVK
jgi:hypothetical protein